MQIFLRLYSDDTLPDKDLLAHLEFRDPALPSQLSALGAEQIDASATIIVENPNDTDGERYLSNNGRSRVPYSWPVNVFTRNDQWFFGVPGKLAQLADPSPYQCELLIERGTRRVSYVCHIVFAEAPQPYPFPQDTKKREGPTLPSTPASSRKSKTGLIAAAALFVAASGAMAFYFQDDIRAMMSVPNDNYYNLKWAYDPSHRQFNVAKAIGRAAEGCDTVNVKIKPVFGAVDQQGAVLSYVRQGQVAVTDILSFQLDCSNHNILGQIQLTFRPDDLPPLANTTIQMSTDRFLSVRISDLPIANPENWHWYEIEPDEGITSRKIGMQGLMITMLANQKKKLKFKIQNIDDHIVEGILTILPPHEP